MDLQVFTYEETSVIDILVNFVTFILRVIYTGFHVAKEAITDIIEHSLDVPAPPFHETLGIGIMEEVRSKEALS